MNILDILKIPYKTGERVRERVLSPTTALSPFEQILSTLIGSKPPERRTLRQPRQRKVLPAITPTPTPEPSRIQDVLSGITPTPSPKASEITEEGFRKGFEKYDAPVATASAQFVEAANKYTLPDPYTPAVLAIMETSGGKNQRFKNNPFNWGMQDMPSLDYAIDRIYSGISERFPYYKDYLESGSLEELFKYYTPSGDPSNPRTSELIERYEEIRKYFP